MDVDVFFFLLLFVPDGEEREGRFGLGCWCPRSTRGARRAHTCIDRVLTAENPSAYMCYSPHRCY